MKKRSNKTVWAFAKSKRKYSVSTLDSSYNKFLLTYTYRNENLSITLFFNMFYTLKNKNKLRKGPCTVVQTTDGF